MARISQIRRDLPNIRTGNIGQLLRTGQSRMRQVLADPQNQTNVNSAKQFMADCNTALTLINNQL